MVGPLRDALKSHAIGRSLAHACARLGILRKGASEEFAKPAGAVCEANEHMQKIAVKIARELGFEAFLRPE